MKVAIYARLSKDTAGISENVDIQIRDRRAYARSMGHKIAGIFSDNDVGASKYAGKPRPGYETLLIAVRANQVDAILITETARLYRRLESHRTSERQRRRTRAKAQDGAGHGGKRPYGDEKGWKPPREDEAKGCSLDSSTHPDR